MADKNQTFESVLAARRNDPRALRGAIILVNGKPRLVFGVVGNHKRFSIEVNGNDFTVCDDPRDTKTKKSAAKGAPPAAASKKPQGKT